MDKKEMLTYFCAALTCFAVALWAAFKLTAWTAVVMWGLGCVAIAIMIYKGSNERGNENE